MKGKQYIIRVFLFAFSFNYFSQTKEIDSLVFIAKANKQDTNQVNALNILSKKVGWSIGNFDTAFVLAKKAQIIAQQLNYKKGIIVSYSNLGIVYWNQGRYPEALKNHFAALRIREEIGDKIGIAASYNNIGNVFNSQNNYPEALKSHFASLKIKEEICIEQKRTTAEKQNIAISYNNIGNVFKNLDNYPEALKNHLSALKIREEIGDKQGIADSYNNIGNVYISQGNYPEALKNYLMSLKIRTEIGNKDAMANSYYNIGGVYLSLNKTSEGKTWLQKGLALSKEIGDPEGEKVCYECLARADSALGNYKGALENYKLYVVYRDSLFNQENTKKSVQTQMQYEFDKKQTADSLKVAEERKVSGLKLQAEKKQRYFLYGGLLLVIAFSVFMFNRFKVTQKQKHIIELQKTEVEKQKLLVDEKQKEILDSIHYAKRIQQALLPSENYLKKKVK